jgi:aspartokinase-like uncharacterized kinase
VAPCALGSVAEELSGGGKEEGPETVPCALGSVEMNCRVVEGRSPRRCPVRWVALDSVENNCREAEGRRGVAEELSGGRS